jgi:hypothetical protein
VYDTALQLAEAEHDRDIETWSETDAGHIEAHKALEAELENLRRLHEVATERTVEFAAVIEKARRSPAYNEIARGQRTDSVYAVLATADTSAVLRERDAEKWEEGNAENYRPETGPNPRNPYRQHEGGEDR